MTEDAKGPEQREPGVVLTPEQLRSRRARNIAIGLAIGAIVVIFYVIALIKMGPGSIPNRLR